MGSRFSMSIPPALTHSLYLTVQYKHSTLIHSIYVHGVTNNQQFGISACSFLYFNPEIFHADNIPCLYFFGCDVHISGRGSTWAHLPSILPLPHSCYEIALAVWSLWDCEDPLDQDPQDAKGWQPAGATEDQPSPYSPQLAASSTAPQPKKPKPEQDQSTYLMRSC